MNSSLALTVLSLALIYSCSAAAATPVSSKGHFGGEESSRACAWVSEILNERVSETCQREFIDLLKDEQDKVFARRAFKEWSPLDGYELNVDDGLYQLHNEKTGDFFQGQWLSNNPVMVWLNGKIIIDESKDKSVFRLLQRIYDKADALDDKVARVNPLELFLWSNEARALNQKKRTEPPLDPGTVGLIWQGAAGGPGEGFSGKENDGGFFPGKFRSLAVGSKDQQVRCEHGVLVGNFQQELSGKNVSVRQTAANTFVFRGYPEDASTIEVKLNQAKSSASVVKLDRHRRPVYHCKGDKQCGKVRLTSTPCSGMYRPNLQEVCGQLWTAMTKEEKFSKVREALESHAGNAQLRYGQNMTCALVYAQNRSLRAECEKFLRSHFPGRYHYELGASSVAVCEDKKCIEKDNESLAGGAARASSEADRLGWSDRARVNYQAVLSQDPKTTTLDAVAMCPTSTADAQARFARCKAPPKGALPETWAAYRETQKDGDKLVREDLGQQTRAVFEKRALEMLMLNRCLCRKANPTESGMSCEQALARLGSSKAGAPNQPVQ